MPTLTFETVVAAPLSKVWEFHEDILGAIPALSPPANAVEVESADLPPRVGTRVVLTARGPLGKRIRWVAVYVEHRPPGPVGDSAAFVDVQESGPFAFWRHEHHFARVDDHNTRLTDRVTYRVPLGPLGRVADRLYVRRQLRAMFRRRHETTRRLLGGPG